MVQRQITQALSEKGWHVIKMHGSAYQQGIPDLYCMHKAYGTRWVELKSPTRKGMLFTPAQNLVFPKYTHNNVGIWILTSVDEIKLLIDRPNILQYMPLNPSRPNIVPHVLREGQLRDSPGKSSEEVIQAKIAKRFQSNGWTVLRIVGNKFQKGLPDLYCMHPRYGTRWVEVKLPDMVGSRFTDAQKETFPIILSHNVGIWIMTGATENEYNQVFKKSNAMYYLMLKS